MLSYRHEKSMRISAELLGLVIVATPLENFIRLFCSLEIVSVLDASIILIILTFLTMQSIKKSTSIFVSVDYIRAVVVSVGFVVLCLVSRVLTPDIVRCVNNPEFTFLLKCFPMLILGQKISDYKLVLYAFKKYILFFGIYAVVGLMLAQKTVYGGSAMECAYDILVGGMFAFSLYITDRKSKYLLVSGVIFIVLFLLGSRGAFITFLVFILGVILLTERKNRKFTILCICAVGILGCSVLMFWDYIIKKLALSYSDIRIVERLISGELFKETGRSRLSEYGIYILKQNPLVVRGLFADRVMMIEKFGGTRLLGFWVDSDAGSSLYAHNFFVEVLVQFGMVLGLILLCYFVYLLCRVCKVILQTNDKMFMMWLTFLVCRGFIPLLVSSSYTLNPWFWLLIGAMISIKNTLRRNVFESDIAEI